MQDDNDIVVDFLLNGFNNNVRSNNGPYFVSSNIWPEFLKSSIYDHAYFVEIFKAVFGDPSVRLKIVNHLFKKDRFIYVDSGIDGISPQLLMVKRLWKKALENKVPCIITWKYPIVIDGEGAANTHYIMIWADPVGKRVLSVDSRGLSYAPDFHPSWAEANLSLKQIFKGCQWIEYNMFDLQEQYLGEESDNDSFCQTWSLQLLEEALNPSDTYSQPTDAYHTLASFWARILHDVPAVKEAVFNTVYCMTHDAGTGKRRYHRYFSTLESLVCGGSDVYYPHDVAYSQGRYTFIEDFLMQLVNDQGQTLRKIMRHNRFVLEANVIDLK